MHREKTINKYRLAPKNSIYSNLALLFLSFAIGFSVIIGVRIVLNHEVAGLDKKIEQESARYQIGKFIIEHIDSIEFRFYKMASTLNPMAATYIKDEIKEEIRNIYDALDVLERGGAVRHKTELNVVGAETIEEVINYTPSENQVYAIAKIDLVPKLQDLEASVTELESLIVAKYSAFEKNDVAAISQSIDNAQYFLKKSDPLFIRMKENASRLLYESKSELEEIKYTVQEKKDFFVLLESIIIACVMLFVIWIGLLSARQIRDISRKLEQAKFEFEKAAAEAKKANEFKSEFLANMSHEIRTPLNAILGFIDILVEKTSDMESLKYLEVVKRSGRSLLTIINDILDLSKIESGKLEIDIIDCSIQDELKEVATLFFEKAKEKSLNFKSNISIDLPNAVKTDPLRIRQVVSNLISNAIKFTPEGGFIELEAYLDEERERIYISISDSGIGISKEHIANLFTAFSQEDSSITRKYGGTGLGLAISSKLISMLSGELSVESEKHKGSKFYFYIPYIKGDINNVKLHNDMVSVNSDIKFSGKVLVVEDVKANQQLMRVLLQGLGLSVDCADDGVIGVAMCVTNEYDLILMDENMPNMNGREAARRIVAYRLENNLPKIPIIALTANALAGDRDKFLAAGMDDYLTKPINKNEIIKALCQFLSNQDKNICKEMQAKKQDSKDSKVEFSLNGIEEELGLDSETAKMLVEEFALAAKDDIRFLNDAIASNDSAKVAFYAHNIKGSAGNLRIDSIFEIAKKIELAAKTDYDGAQAIEDFKQLEQLFKEFLEWLEGI